jgi:hypothetical protein
MDNFVTPKAEVPKKKVDYKAYFKYSGWFNFVLVFLILAGGSFFVLWPRLEKARAEADLSSIYEEYSDLQNELARLESAKGVFENISSQDLDKINRMIPDKENYEKLFPLVETLVTRSGMILVSLKVESKEDVLRNMQANQANEAALSSQTAEEALPSEIEVVRISLEAAGADYPNLKSFLKALESNLKLLDVKNVSFIAGKNCKLEIETYYLKK